MRWLRTFLRSFAAQGRTVLISSHLLAEVAQTVDRVLIIDHGRLLASGRLDELTDDQRTLEDVYLELTGKCGTVTGQLRAELLKQRSTPTTVFLFVAMFGLVALAVTMHVLALGADQLATRTHQLEVFQVGSRAGMLFAGLAGAIAFTAETRYGTIRPTFLVTPSRGPVLAAKVAISALVVIVFGLLAEPLMTADAAVAYAARGIDNQLTGADYLQLLTGGAAAAALWAVAGVGVGALVRNQVGAIVGLCAWMFIVESTSESFVPDFGRLLPGGVGLALAGNTDDLSAAFGALLLVLYAAAATAAGWVATVRRDIA